MNNDDGSSFSTPAVESRVMDGLETSFGRMNVSNSAPPAIAGGAGEDSTRAAGTFVSGAVQPLTAPCWQDTPKNNSVWHVFQHPGCRRSKEKPKRTILMNQLLGSSLPDAGSWCSRCHAGGTPTTPQTLASAGVARVGVKLGEASLTSEDAGRIDRFLAHVADLHTAPFTVVSWNIHGGMSGAQLPVVKELAKRFDIVCLQEVSGDAIELLSFVAEDLGATLFHTGDSKTKNAVLSMVPANRHDWLASFGDERGRILGAPIDAAYPLCTILAQKRGFFAFFTSFHTEGSGTRATTEAAGMEMRKMVECLNLVTSRALADVVYVHVFAGDMNYHQLSLENQEHLERTEYFHPPSVPTTPCADPAERQVKMPADIWLVGPQFVTDVSTILVSTSMYGSDHNFLYGYVGPKRAVLSREPGTTRMLPSLDCVPTIASSPSPPSSMQAAADSPNLDPK